MSSPDIRAWHPERLTIPSLGVKNIEHLDQPIPDIKSVRPRRTYKRLGQVAAVLAGAALGFGLGGAINNKVHDNTAYKATIAQDYNCMTEGQALHGIAYPSTTLGYNAITDCTYFLSPLSYTTDSSGKTYARIPGLPAAVATKTQTETFADVELNINYEQKVVAARSWNGTQPLALDGVLSLMGAAVAYGSVYYAQQGSIQL